MLKNAALVAAVCAGIGIAGVVGDASAADYLKVLNQDRVVQPFNVTVGELEAADIFAADGEEVGDVEDVLMTPDGEIVGLSAEVGGFAGIGEKEVAFELGALTWDGERVIVNMTADQIGSLPDWD